MAYEIPGFTLGTEVAAADLSALQFRAVKMTSTGINVCGANDRADGFLQNDPASGEVAAVTNDGVSKAVASAAIGKGARLATAALGKVATAAATEHIVATALAAATADGEIIPVLVGYLGVA